MENEEAIKKCKQLVLYYFNQNEYRASLWFSTPNPLLGNISPNDVIEAGRGDKLLKFIEGQVL